ncbi:MAG: hypothetical protein HFG00_02845 [Oscillibacter sp.]|nr:hypothetical protein [Oscillibacter sp.]
MANMSYCRFQNTRPDVEDCLDALRDEKRLSTDEAKAGRWMFDDILDFCRDMGIIDSYDAGMLEALFDGLTEKEDDDDE